MLPDRRPELKLIVNKHYLNPSMKYGIYFILGFVTATYLWLILAPIINS